MKSLTYIKNPNICLQEFQTSEVSKIEWKTLNECVESMRTYQYEKKELFYKVNNILEKSILIHY